MTDLEKIGYTGNIKTIKFEGTEERKEESVENGYRVSNELHLNRNNMISELRKYTSESLNEIHTYIYNDNNLLISKNYYDGSREFVSKSKFENVLNDKGRLTKQSEFKSLGNSIVDSTDVKFNIFPDQITEFIYDSNETLIQYNVYDNPTSNLKSVIELRNGEVIKNYLLVGDSEELFGEITYFKCEEYDENNNCIKYKLTENDSTHSYVNVKIEYYK
ncbi:hypothetical protein [Psychroserpens mesophilus]|uniref:hypothetical protein n=1 Tax=Psychroserpens mesophilus TaxID=325473 RepID=UPI00126A6862|nr:hypothetical protein [Psychroserpens mesophilus]